MLLTLAAGQFLMTLDSSVMNVSIATVAKDVGTTVTGIQGAITAYTLVMAALMITGAKVGALIGRKRAFAIGCIIYGCGSFTTAIAPAAATIPYAAGRRSVTKFPATRATIAGRMSAAPTPSRKDQPKSSTGRLGATAVVNDPHP